MSTTDPLGSAAAAAAAAAGSSSSSSAASGKNELGQDTFLKLMVAQLKNQDPFKPADPSEFLGQLAQFSTVSGIQSMQNSMTALTDSMRSNQVLGGTTLVGHSILAASTTVALDSTDPVSGAVQVPEGASSVQLSVTDSTGQLVKRIDISPTEGLNAFAWDGTDTTGTRAAAGTYKIEAIANIGGRNASVETQLVSQVGSVTIDPTTSALTLNTTAGAVALANVRQVM